MREARQRIYSFALTRVVSKMILKKERKRELLGPPDLTRAQILCTYKPKRMKNWLPWLETYFRTDVAEIGHKFCLINLKIILRERKLLGSPV